MPDKPKAQRIADHEAAKTRAEQAASSLANLMAQVAAAQDEQRLTAEAASASHLEAFAEEIAAETKRCKDNEDRHKAACAKHCESIEQRGKAREAKGEAACAHDSVSVVTLDGKVHTVVSAHGLKLGTRGFAGHDRDKPCEGSRYKVACGLSVDAAHDELDHERFDQTKTANCPKCAGAIAMMDSGELPDERGDYLTSAEQLAHAKAENERKKSRPGRP